MPKLVKGGKHAFGWSRVGQAGRVVVPPEALAEYGLEEAQRLILVPGSRTSGGFGLGAQESLRRSPIGAVLDAHPRLGSFRIPEGEAVEYGGKTYCWVQVRDGGIVVQPGTLGKYGVRTGDKLLVIRGSGLALGFPVRGPIVTEATQHGELAVFEPDGETGVNRRNR